MPAAAIKKKKSPELKVVFDTNVLWTGSASDLLKQEVIDVIRANSEHSDLTISWYLPDIVRHERQFQMLAQSLELLPSIRKLERLLGHNLNITKQIIENRVKDAVENQVQDLGINIISLDTARVNWNDVMLSAAYRRPPFSQGEKEKGFRDALLAEDFLQLVADSPVTPKVCRIGLVTNDGLLSETIKQRTQSHSNVRILSSLEELKSLINTLAAEVSEEFVAKIQAKAQAYFFEVDQKESIYYKEDIRRIVQEKFKKQLRAVPEGAHVRENGTWYITPPRFLKKQGQRVSWASRISVSSKAFRYEPSNPPTSSFPSTSPVMSALMADYASVQNNLLFPLATLPSTPLTSFPSTGASLLATTPSDQPSILPAISEKTVVKTGKSLLDVIWSVTVTATGKLSAPKIDSVEFLETSWD